jgi:hypothetical protein
MAGAGSRRAQQPFEQEHSAMAMNRTLARALIAAAALSIPAFASADQASPLCDHEKAEEGKMPTAEKSDSKDNSKAKKTEEKSDRKPVEKETNKS